MSLSDSKRNNIIKSLTAYAKFTGQYESFKSRLKSCGLHYKKPSAIESFLSIMNSERHDNLDQWYSQVQSVLKPNEQLWLRFTALSGLRREEATNAFNILTSKSQPNYYNKETGFLEHFKIRDNGKYIFLRGSKNTFVTAIPESLIRDIEQSEPVNYMRITKRLYEHKLPCRFKHLRSLYATTLREKGLLQEQIDLVQGRLNSSVFLQYYFKQNPKKLSRKILSLLPKLEHKLVRYSKVH